MVSASSGALSPFSLTHVAVTPDPLTIDLRRVTFAKPAAVVALVTKVEALRRTGAPVTVVAPESRDVANYLARAHLPSVLEACGASHDFGSVRERELGLALVEVQDFTDAESINRLARGVFGFAERHDLTGAAQLHDAVCEAGENVTLHSGAAHGYMMAQFFPRMSRFEFAFGDCGVGFYGSLQRVGATSNAHALELAATPGISATGEATRGFGLATVRDNLLDMDGSLLLASGDAYRVYTSAHPDGYEGDVTGSFAGTLVHGTIRT